MLPPYQDSQPSVNFLVRCLGRLMKLPDRLQLITDADHAALNQRHRIVNGIADALCISGFVLGLGLPSLLRDQAHKEIIGWDIGVQFALAVALPAIFVVTATVPRGAFSDFLDYYSLRFGMDARKLFIWFYAPLILLGAVCAWQAYRPGSTLASC